MRLQQPGTKRRTAGPAWRGLLPPAILITAAVWTSAPVWCSAQVADTLALDTLPASSGGGVESAPAADSPAVPYAGALPPSAAEHLDYLISASPTAPGGMGLVAAGMAEAEIALEHVSLAGRNAAALSNMQRHMPHVLHAIDPDEVGRGPGMGFGVVRAARDVLLHIEQIQALDEGLPGVASFHAPYVTRAARGTLARAREAVELARQVQRATSAAAAHRLLERLDETVRGMAYGFDRDGDGRIGYTEDEMGLAQARYHLSLVERLTR